MGVQRLYFEESKRHLVLVDLLELVWVGKLLAIVGDGGETSTGRENRLWQVVACNRCSSVVQSIVVGIRELFSSYCN